MMEASAKNIKLAITETMIQNRLHGMGRNKYEADQITTPRGSVNLSDITQHGD